MYICVAKKQIILKMENIGDWIYVIVLIVVGISSVIGSARKKAKQTQEQESHQTKPREIVVDDTFDDDFWGDMTKKQNDPEKIIIPTIQPQLQKQQSYKSEPKQAGYSFNKSQEGVQTLTTNINTIFADNEEENALITLEDLPSDIDDWRKAFVHNEILNRKY